MTRRRTLVRDLVLCAVGCAFCLWAASLPGSAILSWLDLVVAALSIVVMAWTIKALRRTRS